MTTEAAPAAAAQPAPQSSNDNNASPAKIAEDRIGFREGTRKLSQRFADAVTAGMGSWKFVIGQSMIMTGWIVANTTKLLPMIAPWDPNLFLLNLALSTEAALAASFIMMSQNRQSEKDRATAQHDLQVDIESERGIKEINRKLDAIIEALPPEQIRAVAALMKPMPPPVPAPVAAAVSKAQKATHSPS